MKIVNDLPFNICHDCNACILDVSEQVYYHPDGSHERVVRVGCKREECAKITVDEVTVNAPT